MSSSLSTENKDLLPMFSKWGNDYDFFLNEDSLCKIIITKDLETRSPSHNSMNENKSSIYSFHNHLSLIIN